jgi:hypothetical protein
VLVARYYYSHEIKVDAMGGHVARMGENRNAYRVLAESLNEVDYFEVIGLDERIILK